MRPVMRAMLYVLGPRAPDASQLRNRHFGEVPKKGLPTRQAAAVHAVRSKPFAHNRPGNYRSPCPAVAFPPCRFRPRF
jgi:hypothetical protein